MNQFVNRTPYVADLDNYGVEDHWADPAEFFARGGDCEDFALAKFVSLLRLGWAQQNLRLVIVQDTRRRMPHAVLAVNHAGRIWILDNQHSELRPHDRLGDYAPVLSFSGGEWWLHEPAG